MEKSDLFYLFIIIIVVYHSIKTCKNLLDNLDYS